MYIICNMFNVYIFEAQFQAHIPCKTEKQNNNIISIELVSSYNKIIK